MNNKTELTMVNKLKTNAFLSRLRMAFMYAPIVACVISATSSCNNSTPQAATENKSLKDSLAMAKDTIQAQANAAHSQMDEYATVSARLDSQIAAKDLQISKLKSINSNLASNNKKRAENRQEVDSFHEG